MVRLLRNLVVHRQDGALALHLAAQLDDEQALASRRGSQARMLQRPGVSRAGRARDGAPRRLMVLGCQAKQACVVDCITALVGGEALGATAAPRPTRT